MNSENLVVEPIYIVVIASTIFSIILGLIFKDMLEYQVAVWRQDDRKNRINYKTPNAKVAYVAMSVCVFVAVSSSLLVFIPIYWLATVGGAIVVFPTALLIWLQLGSMLNLWEDKGDEAIDLDRFFEGDREKITGSKSDQS